MSNNKIMSDTDSVMESVYVPKVRSSNGETAHLPSRTVAAT